MPTLPAELQAERQRLKQAEQSALQRVSEVEIATQRLRDELKLLESKEQGAKALKSTSNGQ